MNKTPLAAAVALGSIISFVIIFAGLVMLDLDRKQAACEQAAKDAYEVRQKILRERLEICDQSPALGPSCLLGVIRLNQDLNKADEEKLKRMGC